MFAMSKRYMGDMEFNKAQEKQMKQSLMVMFFIFTLHTTLVFYSAFYMSKEAWAFISGGLFYILFGAYALFEFVKIKIKNNKLKSEEWVPLVDEKGMVIGKAPRSVVHKDKSLLHPVVHLHVLNNKGDVYLQKRPMFKDTQPGKWDTAVGGHVALNETIEQALLRETKEEIGITPTNANTFAQYVWKSDVESELVFSFVTIYNEQLFPDINEVDEGKFWTVSDINHNLGKNIFTPNFEHEYQMLQKNLFTKNSKSQASIRHGGSNLKIQENDQY